MLNRQANKWIPLPENDKTCSVLVNNTRFRVNHNDGVFCFNPTRVTHNKDMGEFLNWCSKHDTVEYQRLKELTHHANEHHRTSE